MFKALKQRKDFIHLALWTPEDEDQGVPSEFRLWLLAIVSILVHGRGI